MFIVVSFVVVIVVLFDVVVVVVFLVDVADAIVVVVVAMVNVIADAIVLIFTSTVPACRRGTQHKRQKGLQIVPTLSAHGIHSLRFIDHGDFIVLIDDHAIVFVVNATKKVSV